MAMNFKHHTTFFNKYAAFTYVGIILFCLTGRCIAVADQTITEELKNYLFTNYSSELRPVCTEGENVTITLDLALRQLMELNEREQVLTINVWFRMRWKDCRLHWNKTDYNNIDHFMVPYNIVWTPDITLFDSAADAMMQADYRVFISSTSLVKYNFPAIIKNVCRVNVRYFPFDTQTCTLTFGSWSYHGGEIDILAANPTGDLETYVKNIEWEILDIPAKRNVAFYNCCAEPFVDITFSIVMKRIPAFYVMTMLFPCLLTTVIAALSFVLPVESGEKVSLGITVLLSLAVFLLVVSESLPPASDNFPIIGNYFAASMVLVSFSCVQSVMVINIFYHGSNGRRVPRWLKVVCLGYMAKILCMKQNQIHDISLKQNEINEHAKMESIVNNNASDGVPRKRKLSKQPTIQSNTVASLPNTVYDSATKENSMPGFKPLPDPTIYVQNQTLMSLDQNTSEDMNKEWRDLSNVFDRLFLILYILVTVTTTLALLLQCVKQA